MARTTTLEERLRILEWAEAGLTNREIASKMNLSRYTVRKWRRRARDGGRPALASKMGRASIGAISTFSAPVRQRLRQWRDDHPGWGAKTLRAELDTVGLSTPLPSQATIGRWLKAEGLTRRYERHSRLPTVEPHPVRRPHQRWQLDAQGNETIPDLGTVALINLSDVYSRVRLLSYPCALERPRSHPTTEVYKTVLRLAFCHWGLPEELQVDHESVFFDSTSKSPFPTRWHLWLVALGIDVVFSDQATDQAIVERSHQLWQGQVVEGQRFRSWSHLYEALLDRRDFLNLHLPCATLEQRPPLVAFPQARHSGRLYRPEVEAALLKLDRVDAFLGRGQWFRRVSKDGNVSLGRQVYHVGRSYKRTEVEIAYAVSMRQLVVCNEAGLEIKRCPIKGVSLEALLGAMGPYVGLPSFQLSFPFSWAEQGRVRLYETMGV